MRLHELEQSRVNRAPDRGAHGALRGRTTRDVVGLSDPGHILDRHFNSEIEVFLLRRIDDCDRPVAWRRAVGGEFAVDRARPVAPSLTLPGAAARSRSSQKSRALIEWTLRGRQAATLRRDAGGRLQALARPRHWRPP